MHNNSTDQLIKRRVKLQERIDGINEKYNEIVKNKTHAMQDEVKQINKMLSSIGVADPCNKKEGE